jgi:hypothetical protein
MPRKVLRSSRLPFLMQTKLNRIAVETDLLFTPWPILSAVTAPIAGYLSEKRSVALRCGLGLVVTVLFAGPYQWVRYRMAFCYQRSRFRVISVSQSHRVECQRT